MHPKIKTLPKGKFPEQLKSVLDLVKSEDLVRGFCKCGIYPFSVQEVISQLPESHSKIKASKEKVADSLINYLNDKRFPEPADEKNNTSSSKNRGKKINVPSGMSVTAEMIPVADDKSNCKPKIKKPKIIENVSDAKIKIALPHNFK